jgi:hypothetical protein
MIDFRIHAAAQQIADHRAEGRVGADQHAEPEASA